MAVVFILLLVGVKWNVSEGAGPKSTKGIEEKERDLEKEALSDRTYALIGVDKWKYADAIYLVHVNSTEKRISLESIPRDLLVLPEDLKDVMTKKQKQKYIKRTGKRK